MSVSLISEGEHRSSHRHSPQGMTNGDSMSIIENANPSALSHLCDDDILKTANMLKSGWICIDEIDDENISGPHCDVNHKWELVEGEWFLCFDAHGLCGIHISNFVD